MRPSNAVRTVWDAEAIDTSHLAVQSRKLLLNAAQYLFKRERLAIDRGHGCPMTARASDLTGKAIASASRRVFMVGAAAAGTAAAAVGIAKIVVVAGKLAEAENAFPAPAGADVPVPYDWNASPPTDTRSDFIAWMARNRGEDPEYLGQRWDRFKQVVANRDIWDERNKRAFLLTPREEFVTKQNLGRAYEHALPRHRLRRDDLRPAHRRRA